jgi:hypothetical protein
MTDFAMAKCMTISSTLFQHKRSIYKCASHPAVYVLIRHHIMINSHQAPDITDFKSCMVANCGSEGCEKRDASYNTGLQSQELQNDKTI